MVTRYAKCPFSPGRLHDGREPSIVKAMWHGMKLGQN